MKLIDTNVVIYFLTRNRAWFEKSYQILSNPDESLAISSLTYFEVFHGVSRKDRELVKDFLQQFVLLDLTADIAECAAILMADFKKSKQVKIDALIAATALIHHIPLVTNNMKDFDWIQDLALEAL